MLVWLILETLALEENFHFDALIDGDRRLHWAELIRPWAADLVSSTVAPTAL